MKELFELWKEKEGSEAGRIQPFIFVFSVQALFSVMGKAL